MSAPGWHPDPAGRYEWRWWDGTKWTGDVVHHGAASVDPWPLETAGVPATHPAAPVPPVMAMPAQPTPTTPPPAFHAVPPAPAPPANSNRRMLAFAAGGVAVLALAIGAIVVLNNDDDSTAPATTVTPTTLPASTSALPTTTPTTVAPSSTAVTTTVLPTTTMPVDVEAALAAAMPASGDIPADWMQYDETQPAEPDDASGYCDAGNWAYLAQLDGATAGVHGPSWDLPDGGWFGLSVFAFPTTDAASEFMALIAEHADGCMTDPVNYTSPESEMDLFEDGSGDDAVWNVAEVNGAFPEAAVDADEVLRVVFEEFISTTYDGTDYSTVFTELQRFERHGRVVIATWLWGDHDSVGFSSSPTWLYTPTDTLLDSYTAIVRVTVVGRLTAAGLV